VAVEKAQAHAQVLGASELGQATDPVLALSEPERPPRHLEFEFHGIRRTLLLPVGGIFNQRRAADIFRVQACKIRE
jgi:hypothetical protein